MTTQTLPAIMAGMWPGYSGAALQQGNTASPIGQTFTFDAATDVLALITRVPFTGTLTEMLFRTGTVTTAGADFDLGLYTVDASGLNTTTPYATNSNGTVTVATSDDNVWKAVAINSGTGVTVTKGDLVAVVLSVSSGTPNVVNISSGNTWFMSLSNFPYRVENTTGSLAKVTNNQAPPFMWNYGGTFVYCEGCSSPQAGNFQTPGNGAERGLRFSLPVPVRLGGCAIALANMAAGADYAVYLLGGSAPYTTLASVTGIDGDVVQAATGDSMLRYYFPTSVQLSANTEYFLVVRQTTANVVQTFEWTANSQAAMGAMPGGVEMYLANRDATAVTNNTAFTETDTIWPMFFLLPDGLDDGAGASGGGLRLAGHGGLAA